MSNSLWPHELHHARLFCPSLSPGVCPNLCPLSQWCHPIISSSVTPFSCTELFPASGSIPMRAPHISWPKYCSFVFSISLSSEYSGLISFRIDWFHPLAVQGTLKSLLRHQLESISFFVLTLSHLYMTAEKTIALTMWTFVGKVMSLLFKTLSRFLIALLLGSKCLLMSRLQSLSAVILEPQKNKVCHCFFFSPHMFPLFYLQSICHEVMGPDTMALIFFSFFYFFNLWWILSYIEMKQPWVYMCSPSQFPLPPPSPPVPSRFSQCTRSERLSHASNLGWWSVSP